MAYKIVIDSGHGGADPGAVYEGRQEKDDTLALALAVGKLLEQNGVDVVYTRTEDVYDTPFEKAVIANNSGADYFVSIHRNAVPTPNTASGIETLVYRDGGIAGNIARAINTGLEHLGFVNRGVIERPNLVVLKRTKMPAVLVEAGFIDNESDNLQFDEQFDSIAAAIANGILDSLNVNSPSHSVSANSVSESSENTIDDMYTVGEGYNIYPENEGVSNNAYGVGYNGSMSNSNIENALYMDNMRGNYTSMDSMQEENMMNMGNPYWPNYRMNEFRNNYQPNWYSQQMWNGGWNNNNRPNYMPGSNRPNNNQEGMTNQQGRFYRVQTGAFRVRRYAEDLVERLRRDGFSPFVVYSDGLFRVQVGAFRQLDNAVKMEQRLRNLGYNTFITS